MDSAMETSLSMMYEPTQSTAAAAAPASSSSTTTQKQPPETQKHPINIPAKVPEYAMECQDIYQAYTEILQVCQPFYASSAPTIGRDSLYIPPRVEDGLGDDRLENPQDAMTDCYQCHYAPPAPTSRTSSTSPGMIQYP